MRVHISPLGIATLLTYILSRLIGHLNVYLLKYDWNLEIK